MTAVRDEVVGWGSVGAPWASDQSWSVSRRLAHQLHAIGIRHAFGILGGGIAPFSAGLQASPIPFFHFRHEAGAGFAAIEAHFETGAPTALVVTTSPGLVNALNPVRAARMDGAKLLVISGFTGRGQVGRGAVQETSSDTMPADVTRPGSLFHDVAIPETAAELDRAVARFQRGFASPGGFVAHLGLPLPLQTQMADGPPPAPALWRIEPPAPGPAVLDRCLEALKDPFAVLWVGHGARHAAAPLRRFAERAGLQVVGSPRSKGVFPEDHPLFVGVSGAGGSAAVRERFATRRPKTVLVVGTRLGEVTSFLAPGLTPTERWWHVDVDPTAFGAAFPGVQGEGVVADAAAFFEALLARADATGWTREPREIDPRPLRVVLEPRAGDVRPTFLLQALQRQVVEQTRAVIGSEAGTSFTWCNTLLRFSTPDRYRTSAAWGSMGHFTTGCVGTALVGDRPVVAVVGDGAMLMNNEINTAVQYGARCVWIVLNDAQLGLNEHGMQALGMRPVETQLPRTDFVAFARSQGADGVAVATEDQVEDALERALSASGPFVIDVAIDRTIPPPVLADRIRSLRRQAGA